MRELPQPFNMSVEQERDHYKALAEEMHSDISQTIGAVGTVLKESGVDFSKMPAEGANQMQVMIFLAPLLKNIGAIKSKLEGLIQVLVKYAS